VAARLAEEKEAKRALSALEKLDVGSKEFESKFRTLRKAVLAHAHSEETKEFDKLAEKLDTTELEDMREKAEEVEAQLGPQVVTYRTARDRRWALGSAWSSGSARTTYTRGTSSPRATTRRG
jgi:hemerythrin superfamily protein